MLIGVNVHDEAGPSSIYANASGVASAIQKLRPAIVRGIGPSNTSGMAWLASQGVGYILMCRTPPETTNHELYEPGIMIAKDAGVPVAIEGLNEPDIAKPTNARYPDWCEYTRASQAALWDVGQCFGVTVLGPSVVFKDGAAQLGPVPMDKLNVHTYGWPHSAVPDVAGAVSQVRSLAPNAGVWVTECGGSTYRTWPFGRLDMTEAQQQQLTMLACARAQELGAEAFVVYELVDQHNGWTDFFASFNREKNFGVFRADWSPKPIVLSLSLTE